MAFQQAQQQHQASRHPTFTQQPVESQQVPASPTRKRPLEDSQEWILFSPALRSDGQSQSQSHTSQTPRTATHLSDFGSLETHVRSQPVNEQNNDAGEATCLGTEVDDDDNAELDSLDDGLHAFHHHPFSSSSHQLDQSGGAVLPTHDGLGMFPSSAGVQEQLWQFERHNPHRRRHVRRRSSVQKKLDKMGEEQELDEMDERTARIEKWRLEQSRAVLEEIERETRRRRRRMSRMSGVSDGMDAQMETHGSTAVIGRQRIDSIIAEEEPENTKNDKQPEQANESWWQRLTRRVIQDLIGLDETTLSVIFGEQLPEDPSPTPTQPSPIAVRASQESGVTFHDRGYTWETKLIERIAKELGVLVHQLSEHEGAFNTYMRTREEPEYAGLPLLQSTPRLQHSRRRPQSSDRVLQQNAHGVAASDALFVPTLATAAPPSAEGTNASLWGIEEEPSRFTSQPGQPIPQTQAQQTQQDQEREYWERDVDVKMIFSYLKRRFSSTTTDTPNLATQSSANGPLPASWITNSNQQPTTSSAFDTSPESLRRAEVIRRQHPLVSRAAAAAAAAAQSSRRRESALLLRRPHMQKRAGSSSCASQSTKRSRQSRSGSSRHYWDIGGGGPAGSVGSVGSGGPAMSSAGLGGWGEV